MSCISTTKTTEQTDVTPGCTLGKYSECRKMACMNKCHTTAGVVKTLTYYVLRHV